jgi:hypothetical protein
LADDTVGSRKFASLSTTGVVDLGLYIFGFGFTNYFSLLTGDFDFRLSNDLGLFTGDFSKEEK